MDGSSSRVPGAGISRTGSSDSESTPTAAAAPINITNGSTPVSPRETSPTVSYNTTDDEDALHMAVPGSRPNTASTPSLSLASSPSSINLLRPDRASLSSSSESYFPTLPAHAQRYSHPRLIGSANGSTTGSVIGTAASGSSTSAAALLRDTLSIQRRRGIIQQGGAGGRSHHHQQGRAKSPLALNNLAAAASGVVPLDHGALVDGEWDYSETEWWGWVILVVTWIVFVVGMGSCFGVWSWAWDVGTTPYAPPELEDDPTLPITGYYPALMILTCVMAWVWVVVAWVGMKYFRHARVSGD